MEKQIKIAIATTSQEKIKGVLMAFARIFEIDESKLNLCYVKVDSGVSDQPFDDETYQGALNRVNNLKRLISNYDFYVSCEAGIEGFFNQYCNVQVVCIYDAKTNQYLWGKSAGWQIPNESIDYVRNNTLDKYLRDKGISCIEELLGEKNSRREEVAQATELALYIRKLHFD